MVRRTLLLVGVVVGIPIVVVLVAIRLTGLGGSHDSDVVLRVADPDTNVSRAPGPQSEAAIAVDPRNGRTLVAGSNDIRGDRMRAFSSTDGGATWD